MRKLQVILLLLVIVEQIICVSLVDETSEISFQNIDNANVTEATNIDKLSRAMLFDELEQLLLGKQIPVLPENPVNSTVQTVGSYAPCKCKDNLCNCCTNMFSLKNCMKLSFIPEEFRFEFRVVMNGTQVFKRKYSGRNPEPACMNFLGFSIFKMCADFRNVHFRGRNMHICLDTFVKYNRKRYLKRQFDCMLFGEDGVKIIRPQYLEVVTASIPPIVDVTDSPGENEDYDSVESEDDEDDDDEDDY